MASSSSSWTVFLTICLLSAVFCHNSDAIYIGKIRGYDRAYEVRHFSLDRRVEAHPNRPFNVLDRKANVDPLENLNPESSAPTSPTEPATKPSSKLPSPTSNAISSVTTKSVSTATPSALSPPLPQAFDASLGNNFTAPSCPQFFKKFLNDPTFTGCLPLSLLLLNSQSFFQDQSDPSTLAHVLDVSCNVVSANCANIMTAFAVQLKDSANCGPDYQAQNPVVLRAYDGFVSYAPVYQAGCLKADAKAVSSSTPDKYCFVAAIEDVDEPANSYLYYLPLGVSLPGSSRPTCSSCVQQTMSFFAQAAQNMSNPLSSNYDSAATLVNSGCGPNFVNSSVAPIQGSGSRSGAMSNQLITQSRGLLFIVMGLAILLV